MAAIERVEEVLAQPARPSAMRLPDSSGRLSAENVTYVPPGARVPILANVSFQIEPGQALGIVGASAAGKSTLARLIVGAAKPTAGVLRLDGADIYSWDRAEFGKAVGYVPQDLQLFEGTIKDNISRFREADSADIVAAARAARVHQMILGLPKGYETILAPSGAPLSGGQRQRLALARAIFGGPKLVVLDEPNSNLDGEGEAALREIVNELKMIKASVVMIAHRPSVLVGLDLVLVLANGGVVDFGPVDKIMPRIAPGYAPLRSVGGRP
jgi:ABC-type protease/lipase transport system fused ATPase/permease subunit